MRLVYLDVDAIQQGVQPFFFVSKFQNKSTIFTLYNILRAPFVCDYSWSARSQRLYDHISKSICATREQKIIGVGIERSQSFTALFTSKKHLGCFLKVLF